MSRKEIIDLTKKDEDYGFNDVEKGAKTVFGAILGVWILGALLSLAFGVVLIWGIVQLVQAATS